MPGVGCCCWPSPEALMGVVDGSGAETDHRRLLELLDDSFERDWLKPRTWPGAIGVGIRALHSWALRSPVRPGCSFSTGRFDEYRAASPTSKCRRAREFRIGDGSSVGDSAVLREPRASGRCSPGFD